MLDWMVSARWKTGDGIRKEWPFKDDEAAARKYLEEISTVWRDFWLEPALFSRVAAGPWNDDSVVALEDRNDSVVG